MRQVSLCLPLRWQLKCEVLLGYKKRGFGRGKVVSLGGEIVAGETARQAAARELAEECGLRVEPATLRDGGQIDYDFPARPAWNLRAQIFLAYAWQGEVCESEEVRPCWFALDAIPYTEMWADAVHWLALALAGRSVTARFVFAEDNETLRDYKLSFVLHQQTTQRDQIKDKPGDC
jgi:8-oxo-dGTP diphosphatase